MQRLLEHRTPFPSGGGGATARRQHMTALCGIMIVAAYVAFVVVPRLAISDDDFALHTTVRPVKLTPKSSPSSSARGDEATVGMLPLESNHHALAVIDEIPLLPPWGYNHDRNVPRWKAIYRSIISDSRVRNGNEPLSFVDHGADQGYFSISIAKFIPQATVIGLELGGVGGEIWSKGKKPMDVLKIQESHLDEHRLSNVIICQTRMNQAHFFALRDAESRVDYQLMLSVFHWFDLPTRAEFEAALIALFATARTTFIELPTIGDNSELIRKQVGYKNFVKWYDGRTDIGQVLRDAAQRQQVFIRVQRILESKWIRWTREVFRVDYLGSDLGAPEAAVSFQCDKRRLIYGCNTSRHRFQACPQH